MIQENARESSKSTYAFLEAAFNRGEIVVRETGVDTHEGPIRHAIDPSGRRILMIPVSEGEFESVEDDSAGTSVSLRKERYADGSRIEPFIIYRCEQAFLRDTFAAFIDDVLDEFEQPRSRSSGAPLTARLVLDRWRRLFATRGQSLLTDQRLVGLAAELRVLNALLDEIGPAALEAWTGPGGSDHDFVLPHCAIEVKGTQRKTGMEVEINGLGQLDLPNEGSLYLAAARIAMSPTGAMSVPALVNTALESGADSETFTEKLELVGYHHARAEEYEKKKMDFLEERFFAVTGGFPKIDRTLIAEVPHSDRIRNVSYLLDLTAHDTVPGALEANDVQAFLREVE